MVMDGMFCFSQYGAEVDISLKEILFLRKGTGGWMIEKSNIKN